MVPTSIYIQNDFGATPLFHVIYEFCYESGPDEILDNAVTFNATFIGSQVQDQCSTLSNF
jgi:hypothetical protein